ncbi:hypothetical protein MYX84_12800 [Acidobacteria bacterium AH-259-O06]|nr:hypothetical protein [Acidobacteria bacterium AH-259-O06]
MSRKKNTGRSDFLDELVGAADGEVLRELVREFAPSRPEIRRECVGFLKNRVSLTPSKQANAISVTVFALWDELQPDLAELDEYGGGDYETQDHVGDLLYELHNELEHGKAPKETRRALLEEVLPYIRSGNSGMVDPLYDVAFASCYDEEDWRHLAEQLESAGTDWEIENARRIYRKIGDREKYLVLRARKMEYGLDYYDLATFYWEAGEPERALEVAREGIEKGQGRMTELRSFLADRAKESGDRKGYLDLQFAEALDGLTANSYRTFKELCTDQEWAIYQPEMLSRLARTWKEEQLKIRMLRKEYEQAIAILSEIRYPNERRWAYEGTDVMKIAARLEKRYPEQVLSFYMGGLGNLNRNATRGVYADKARVMVKVRRVWLDVMKRPSEWESYACKVKILNQRRPAFQDEFAKAVPGWNDL